jgi:SlyX protein
MNDINEELIDLQTRLAYQEDTITQLNLVVTKQDGEIIQLQKQMLLLAKRLDELLYVQEQGGGDVVNERPPHY